MSDYTDAVERRCKGLQHISSGPCASCPECRDSYDIRFDPKRFYAVREAGMVELRAARDYAPDAPIDTLTVLRLEGEEYREWVRDYFTDHPRIGDDAAVKAALWEEWKFRDFECSEEFREVVFAEQIANGTIATDPYCSSRDCDCCGAGGQGDRYDGHAVTADGGLIHLTMCPDCVVYFANGEEPENWEG